MTPLWSYELAQQALIRKTGRVPGFGKSYDQVALSSGGKSLYWLLIVLWFFALDILQPLVQLFQYRPLLLGQIFKHGFGCLVLRFQGKAV